MLDRRWFIVIIPIIIGLLSFTLLRRLTLTEGERLIATQCFMILSLFITRIAIDEKLALLQKEFPIRLVLGKGLVASELRRRYLRIRKELRRLASGQIDYETEEDRFSFYKRFLDSTAISVQLLATHEHPALQWPERYVRVNAEAIERGVKITRIFFLDPVILSDKDSAEYKTLAMNHRIGVETRYCPKDTFALRNRKDFMLDAHRRIAMEWHASPDGVYGIAQMLFDKQSYRSLEETWKSLVDLSEIFQP